MERRPASDENRLNGGTGGAALDTMSPATEVSSRGNGGGSDLPEPSDPRISPKRAGLALLAIVVIAAAAAFAVRRNDPTDAPVDATGSFFAPYVDVTLPPTYPFEEAAANPSRQIALGFVVAASPKSCAPSWGGYYSLAQASRTLDLERRLVQLRADGGEAIGSFGGEAGTELAVACKSEASLTHAYKRVIERYDLRTIDLDIEGAALGNSVANERRAGAIASLERDRKLAGGHLAVWLTLPVTPHGLAPEAVAVVSGMLARDVKLAGVNAMTMDFGSTGAPAHHVLRDSEDALSSLNHQLQALYLAAGLKLSAAAAWGRIGVTPMIGDNDVAGEVFTLADARALTTFAKHEHVARISMWSLNRDEQCSAGTSSAGGASNHCSGVNQSPLAFSKVFAQLHGKTERTSARPAEPIPDTVEAGSESPSQSPYPIWKPNLGYPAGYKVVWDKDVFETRWYSEGEAPGTPSESGHESAWLLVGPVLPGEKPPVIPKPKPGTYPQWSASTVYHNGARVLYDGLPYEAKYYSDGEPPPSEPEGSQTTPWKPLYKIPGEPSLAPN